MPFLLRLSAIYDCRVALRLWGEGKGWPGVSPDHPMLPQRSKWGQMFLITPIQRAGQSEPFPSQTTGKFPNYLMKKDKSQNSQKRLRKERGPPPEAVPLPVTLKSWDNRAWEGRTGVLEDCTHHHHSLRMAPSGPLEVLPPLLGILHPFPSYP